MRRRGKQREYSSAGAPTALVVAAAVVDVAGQAAPAATARLADRAIHLQIFPCPSTLLRSPADLHGEGKHETECQGEEK